MFSRLRPRLHEYEQKVPGQTSKTGIPIEQRRIPDVGIPQVLLQSTVPGGIEIGPGSQLASIGSQSVNHSLLFGPKANRLQHLYALIPAFPNSPGEHGKECSAIAVQNLKV